MPLYCPVLPSMEQTEYIIRPYIWALVTISFAITDCEWPRKPEGTPQSFRMIYTD